MFFAVAEIHRSRIGANDVPYSMHFFVDIAESVPLEVALVLLRSMVGVLRGQAKFDVVFAVMQYCMVGTSASRTLLQVSQFWDLRMW